MSFQLFFFPPEDSDAVVLHGMLDVERPETRYYEAFVDYLWFHSNLTNLRSGQLTEKC
jgi:hypothetical protein